MPPFAPATPTRARSHESHRSEAMPNPTATFNTSEVRTRPYKTLGRITHGPIPRA